MAPADNPPAGVPEASWWQQNRTLLLAAGGVALAGLGFWWSQRYSLRRRRKLLLSQYREAMLLSPQKLQEIRDEFERQIKLGLQHRGQSTMMMLPTMIDILPTGEEQGVFYALDMGGTNFRVVTITLSKRKNKVGEVDMRSYPITPEMKAWPFEQLFDTMAAKLIEFAAECAHTPRVGAQQKAEDKPVVGFCFSFPVAQTAVGAGKIIRMNKGFVNQGAVEADPVQLLSEALERQGMPAQVRVLINDTVGVLAAGRYQNPEAMIGLILGTGTNACYVERTDSIKTLPKDYRPNTELMCINTEWGNFNSTLLPRLPEDFALDEDSANAGNMIFEKLVSGMYLGEIACRMMLKVAREGALFNGLVPDALLGPPWAFNAGDVANIHSDETYDLSTTAERLHEKFGLAIEDIPYGCRRNVKYICKLVGQRSASLVGVSIAALVRHMGRDLPSTYIGADGEIEDEAGVIPTTVVAADGSLILKYDKFRLAAKVALAQICGKEVASKIVIKLTEDGSSIGAACLAASAATTNSENV